MHSVVAGAACGLAGDHSIHRHGDCARHHCRCSLLLLRHDLRPRLGPLEHHEGAPPLISCASDCCMQAWTLQQGACMPEACCGMADSCADTALFFGKNERMKGEFPAWGLGVLEYHFRKCGLQLAPWHPDKEMAKKPYRELERLDQSICAPQALSLTSELLLSRGWSGIWTCWAE